MKSFKIVMKIVIISIIITCSAGCISEKKQSMEEADGKIKTAIMLDWSINTNHTGLYVALEKGYYEEQGLIVEILEMGDPGPAQLIASGKLDFGVSYQEQVTNALAQGIPLVSLAAVIQHNTSGFASLPESGIDRPRDLENKRYGGWGSPMETAVISALMKQDGADPKSVRQIDIGTADFFSVIGKDIDFAWIFYGWDGIRAELEKKKMNLLMLREYADFMDYYTPTIITAENLIANDPELVRKFIAAVSKGYDYTIEHPQEAGEILLKYAPELDEELVFASQKWLADKYCEDAPQWGWQRSEVWRNYAEWMFREGLLETQIETSKAFTNDYLPKK